MIVTDRFVFLHLHKSGGTFVNKCLLRFLPDARQLGYHLPRRLVPADSARLPILGFVRNPWSYYVSWYSFQRGLPQPNALFRLLSKNGELEFEGTISRMLALGEDDALLDQAIAALPAEYGTRGINLPGFALEEIRGSRRGFYAFLYGYLYGGSDSPLHLGRMEQLRIDLLSLLETVGQEVSEAMRRHILEGSERNVSRHTAYADYYSQTLRQAVADRDEEVIERHGYRFGEDWRTQEDSNL